MTAMSLTYRPTRRPPLLALCALALVVATLPHAVSAVQRHGEVVNDIRRCVDDGRTMQLWYNPDTLRSANLCFTGSQFGVWISKLIDHVRQEITTIPKGHSLEHAMQYLTNRGYMQMGTPEFEAWIQTHPEHIIFLP